MNGAHEVACSQCDQSFDLQDLAQFDGRLVCATCKPEYLQKIREGVATYGRLEIRLASRWRRLFSSLIDSLILLAILLPIQWYSGALARSAQQTTGLFGAFTHFRPENALWAVIGLLLTLLLNWNLLPRGQTIGKRALKLRIVRKDGTGVDPARIVLRRMLPLQVAGLIPVIGILAVYADVLSIFRSSRYTLHDDIADTKVIDLRPLEG